MTINSALAADAAKLQQTSPFIELFILDSTNIAGGQIYRFTNFKNSTGSGCTFAGVTYNHFPIQSTGWDYSTSGAQARPQLAISMVDKTLLAAVINLGDLVSANVTRIRTYEKHLDTGAEPNSAAYWGPNKMVIEEMSSQDEQSIIYTLANKLDLPDMRFPGRQVLKDQSVKNLYAPGVSRTRFR